MNEKVEKRRAALINLTYVLAILAIVFLFFKYCFAIAAPFLISFFFAMLLQKPVKFLDKKTKGKLHTLWCLLLVLLSITIILIPIILIISSLVREIAGFISYFTNQLNDMPTFLATLEKEILNILAFLPDGLYTKVSDNITTTFGGLINNFDLSVLGIKMDSVTSTISSGVTGIFNVVKNIPSILISIVIFIISWILFTKDYSKVVAFIKNQLPDNKKNILTEIKSVFSKTILKMLRAYSIIMFITFCEIFIGLSILNAIGSIKISYIFIISIGIAVFDILPVAGSGGILIPWMLVCLILGNPGGALGLLIIYAVISVIRQYIEPKIVGDSLGVHPIITLAGLYFGLKLFGFMGMFIVPICVMTIKAFNDSGRIHIYKSVKRN